MPAGTVVEDIHETAEAPPDFGSGLNDLISGKVRRPRRTMLYGVQGVGKSTWAASSANAVFVPTEEGLNDIDCKKFPVCKSYDEFCQRLQQLGESDHSFETVVVDSLDWLEQLVWQKVCEEKGVSSIEDIGYGKGYVAAVDLWKKVLACLDWLREHKCMAILLIAHARIERYDNPETDGYDRYTPQLHKRAAAVVQEWCDEVFFATYKVYTKTSEDGLKTKGIGGDERIIRCTEKPFAVAKNRLSMPDEISMDYAKYLEYQEN